MAQNKIITLYRYRAKSENCINHNCLRKGKT